MDKKKVLIIDDEKELVELLKVELEENQYDVLTAYNGQEGLERARKEEPDLLILDLMLPKIDGFKVCSLLKKDARYAKILILMFTARAHAEDEKLAREVGADAYVTKPFDRLPLLEKIQRLLAGRLSEKL